MIFYFAAERDMEPIPNPVSFGVGDLYLASDIDARNPSSPRIEEGSIDWLNGACRATEFILGHADRRLR